MELFTNKNTPSFQSDIELIYNGKTLHGTKPSLKHQQILVIVLLFLILLIMYFVADICATLAC